MQYGVFMKKVAADNQATIKTQTLVDMIDELEDKACVTNSDRVAKKYYDAIYLAEAELERRGLEKYGHGTHILPNAKTEIDTQLKDMRKDVTYCLASKLISPEQAEELRDLINRLNPRFLSQGLQAAREYGHMISQKFAEMIVAHAE